MNGTKETAETGQPSREEAREAVPAVDERARGCAYLDLWERHLVHAALSGPVPAGRSPGR